jgi:DNA (cytosine-5)-methyltransferase 1
MIRTVLRVAEFCAGGGGQALGLEMAGWAHTVLVDNDPASCATLRAGRPAWNVLEADIRGLDAAALGDPHLIAAGVPCTPFSVAGTAGGAADGRDLFPATLALVRQVTPPAVLLENVPGLEQPCFDSYRAQMRAGLEALGYRVWWRQIAAHEHGVPQTRTRLALVALRLPWAAQFTWPAPDGRDPGTVGSVLAPMMGAGGWPGATAWALGAAGLAPVIAGGSHRHGGPDLGPSRAKAAWARLGVDGWGIADEPPGPAWPAGERRKVRYSAAGRPMPMLTVEMAARLQGFPLSWRFAGRKTAACRQVGNAFPPPVAAALGRAIADALGAECTHPPAGP